MSAANFFEGMEKKYSSKGQAEGIDQWRAKKEFNYEALVVKVFLKHFGLLWRQADLEKACEEATGERHLTFAWFHQAYPTFPVRLGARDILGTSELLLSEAHNCHRKEGILKDRFFNSYIFKAYEPMLEDFYLEADVVGMIFRCQGVPHYILHNHDRPAFDRPGTRLCKTRETLEKIELYVIEPLQQYLDELGERWRPEISR